MSDSRVLDLLRGRGRWIGVVVVIVAAIVGARQFAPDAETPLDPTGSRDVIAARGNAQDAAATTLMQSAATAMETVLVTYGSYSAGTSLAAQVLPSITWLNGTPGSVPANSVGVVSATETSVTLAAISASGVTYTYAKTPDGQVRRECGPGCTW